MKHTKGRTLWPPGSIFADRGGDGYYRWTGTEWIELAEVPPDEEVIGVIHLDHFGN
jgi:hypothetical protein